MKPVFLNFTDDQGTVIKTFSVCSLKTGVMDNIFDIAEKAEELKKKDIAVKEVRAFYKDLKAIITDIFKGQFSYDELNHNVEQDELMRVFNEICGNVSGELRKN